MATAGEKLAALRAKLAKNPKKNGHRRKHKVGAVGAFIAGMPDLIFAAGEGERVLHQGKDSMRGLFDLGKLEMGNYTGIDLMYDKPRLALIDFDYAIPGVADHLPRGVLFNYGMKWLGLKGLPKVMAKFGVSDLKIPFTNWKLF